ncbi:hypothetical protein LHP98_12330 [Rhodobacter sp. Har01]|uniref:hypothetical protein n=1 Tax=Rhodobacter sp. Har01 TaxID=2883999 RepID=UPI001D081C26|nr:hypothetical protein [Rhodobacter sp. Har01]MCB6178914.1 hypothetical protein [Rhodobacter sp. Har01]
MRAILLTPLLAAPAFADPVSGIDDPAFRAPFETALATDAPLALIELHKAALAGNTAALLSLPAVMNWFGKDVPRSVLKQLLFVNGVGLVDALAEADPAAKAWGLMYMSGGKDMDFLDRAIALYAAGEAAKGTALFVRWQQETQAYLPLPPGFFDLPVPDWAVARHLKDRLTYVGGDYPAAAEALLAERLKLDDRAGWMGLALYAALHLPPENRGKVDQQRIDRILSAAGYSPAEGLARMTEVIPALQVFQRSVPVLSPETALAAMALMAEEPEFGSLTTFCQTRCPASVTACATAYVAAFGHPQGIDPEAQPFVSLISQDAFFSSPRGQKVFLQSTHRLSGADRADSPVQRALRQIDACLADAVLSAAQ